MQLRCNFIHCNAVRLFCVFAVFAAGSVLAEIEESIRFFHYSISDGLPSGNVYDMAQDRYGFLWFGGFFGLTRFNGNEFERFVSDPDDPSTISDSAVRKVLVDISKNVLWIATTQGGLNQYDIEKNQFTQYKYNSADINSLRSNDLVSLLQDKEGILWIGYNSYMVTRFDPVANTFTHIDLEVDSEEEREYGFVFNLIEDSFGTIWAATSQGLHYFDSEKNIFEKILSVGCVGLYEDSNGNIWVGSRSGAIYILDAKNKTIEEKYPSHVFGGVAVTDIVAAPNNELWVATLGAGLFRVNPANDKMTAYTYQSNNVDTIRSNNIRFLNVTKDNVLWLGYSKVGISRLSYSQLNVKHLVHSSENPNSLYSNPTYAIFEDSNKILWVASEGSVINRIDRVSGTIKHYPLTPAATSNSLIHTIVEDSTGRILVGGWNLGVQRFDVEQDRFVHYLIHDPNDTNSISANNIQTIHEDSKNRFWLGILYGSLDRFDPVTNEVTHFYNDDNNPAAIKGKEFFSIFEDTDDVFWFGTFNAGLNRYDEKTKQFKNYRSDEVDKESILSGVIYVIYEDTKKRFWIGSRSGLSLFDRVTGKAKRYTISDSLAGYEINGILEDDNGDLWLGTNNGLSKFSPDTEKFDSYDYSDGLQKGSFGYGVNFKAKDGQMFFGGINGVNSFYPNDMVHSTDIPYVALTQFKLFNKPIQIAPGARFSTSLFTSEKLDLNYSDTIFTIEFSALNYVAPEKVRYRYKLDGFESEYNEVDNSQRSATYTNLNPGSYQFLISASSISGLWGDKKTALTIVIAPQYWQTIWFKAVVIAVFLGLIAWVYSVRVRYIHNINRDLEKQVSERTYDLTIAKEEADAAKIRAESARSQAEIANNTKSIFLAKMSHELRTPLNAILGFSELLIHETKEDVLAINEEQKEMLGHIQSGGEYLLDLINNVLDLSKIEAGKITINLHQFDLFSMLYEVENFFVLKAETKGISLRFNKSNNLPQFVVGDQLKLRQICINFISNAVKFTDHGGVTVSVNKLASNDCNSHELEFQVEDTGVGIPDNEINKLFEAFSQTTAGRSANEGTGLGLIISKEFALLMGGRVEVKSEVRKGSVFSLYVTLAAAKLIND